MLHFFKISVFLFVFAFSEVSAQSVLGKWRTVDDSTGESKAIIKIYEEDGKVFGKIVRLFKATERNRVCTECEGDKKNMPFEGFVIIEGLEKVDNEYEGGVITDPENGKTYECKIWLDEDNPNLLNVRGYVSILYRTQTWERLD